VKGIPVLLALGFLLIEVCSKKTFIALIPKLHDKGSESHRNTGQPDQLNP
jgi:hypothetical protein